MYHRDLCYASATNKLSYFIKRLLPVVFVQLRKASRKPGNSLHTLPFPHCSPLRVEAMLLVAQMIKTACSVGDLGSIPGLGRSPSEGMATHSNICAWRIPWTEEPGGLQSMGSQRVGHS